MPKISMDGSGKIAMSAHLSSSDLTAQRILMAFWMHFGARIPLPTESHRIILFTH